MSRRTSSGGWARRVQIQQSRKGGRLVIHYYDPEQLQGLIERLLGQDAE